MGSEDDPSIQQAFNRVSSSVYGKISMTVVIRTKALDEMGVIFPHRIPSKKAPKFHRKSTRHCPSPLTLPREEATGEETRWTCELYRVEVILVFMLSLCPGSKVRECVIDVGLLLSIRITLSSVRGSDKHSLPPSVLPAFNNKSDISQSLLNAADIQEA
ncbi:hypothetical protein TWF191_005710 [Orbilia oligospora]|uniref:Uncharacterized protein n=1 Tax=Orbilia oligospora TaxID=2813651 RepID=A0A7C8VGE3_ORBOL|nr:hypothetical protein TWF191_005710 [Orbilia oligospora]